MIEREVDVVERVANLVCDCGGESSDYRAFLGLVQLTFEFARACEFRGHLVEGGSERAHLIESIGRHLHVEVTAGDLSRRG